MAALDQVLQSTCRKEFSTKLIQELIQELSTKMYFSLALF